MFPAPLGEGGGGGDNLAMLFVAIESVKEAFGLMLPKHMIEKRLSTQQFN